jgi:hypothetical protein
MLPCKRRAMGRYSQVCQVMEMRNALIKFVIQAE